MSRTSGISQDAFLASIHDEWNARLARAQIPSLPETSQPAAIRGLPAAAAGGDRDVIVIDDFEEADLPGPGREGWAGAEARRDPERAFRDVNVGGTLMAPSGNVRLERREAAEGAYLRATYLASPRDAGPSTWAVRVSLKDRGLPVKLQEFDGIFLKARGEGVASVQISVRDDAESERAPTLAAVIPLTREWRAYYLPWRNMPILTFWDLGSVEYQGIALDEETVAALWIFGAADFFHRSEKATGLIEVDDVALFRSDPIRDGRLALGPGFTGVVPGDGRTHARDASLDRKERAFSVLGIIANDGEWRSDGTLARDEESLTVRGRLSVRSDSFQSHMGRIEQILLIFTAEPLYDREGRYLRSDNVKMSTRLTATGLPIQSYEFPYYHERPVQRPNSISIKLHPRDSVKDGDLLHWNFDAALDTRSLLPGYYRVRFDTMVVPFAQAREVMGRHLSYEMTGSLNLDVFPAYASRLLDGKAITMYDELIEAFQMKRQYLMTVRVGDPASPRAVWTLLARYAGESTRGTVALEDREKFQYGFRNAFQGPLILPRLDGQGRPVAYALAPDLPLALQDRLPWLERGLEHGLNFLSPTIYPFDYESGRIRIRMIEPGGKKVDLGEAEFRGASLTGMACPDERYRLRFPEYGLYRLEMEGYIDDVYDIRHTAAGTYEFHVGNRITMSTACKPGTPFFVGERYPPMVEVNPPSPADVCITVRYLPSSDPHREVRHEVRGRANRFGYFFPKPGYSPLVFTDPGEYLSEVFLSYIDKQGVHWYGGQAGGSVVALPYEEAPIQLRGVDAVTGASPYWREEWRGRFLLGRADNQPNKEFLSPKTSPDDPYWRDYTRHDDGVVPYSPGDVTYFTTDPLDPNYFEYFIEIFAKGGPSEHADDEHAQGYGIALPRHLDVWGGTEDKEGSRLPAAFFPNYDEPSSCIYFSAIRPGFVALSMVTDGNDLQFHWRPSFNDFGNQRASGPVGDMPDDVYRFMAGGVVRDRESGRSAYGAYTSAAVMLAPGEYEVGVLSPGTSPLFRQADCEYHLLYGVEAGTVLEVGDRLGLGGATVPAIPVHCRWEVTTPSGELIVREGDGNDIGRCSPDDPIVEVDEPGVWRMRAIIEAQGVEGYVTGVCDGAFEHYAVAVDSPDLIRIDVAPVSRIAADRPTRIQGRITAPLDEAVLHYTLQFPGTIMDIGDIPVEADGTFTYRYDPLSYGVMFQNFDVRDIKGDHKGIETVLLSLFLEGIDRSTGEPVHSARKVVIHGERLIDIEHLSKAERG